VQYTLDDPDAYRGEVIVVVGAGDAAIENAVALAKANRVLIVNRSDEFNRVKEGNLNLVLKAIDEQRLECAYQSACARIDRSDGERPWALTLTTAAGESRIACDRIIARIGAVPPRKFVESCGIAFPNQDPAALPVLSSRYESSVPGLYVIGALGGYPLIKQAMNQGYEAVEYALGRSIQPADHPLLAARLEALPFGQDVDGTLAQMQARIPLFAAVNPLNFRELILGSEVSVRAPGELIFCKNDYTNSFFTIVSGTVEIELGEEGRPRLELEAGQFFGEMSLLSGRRRSATVYAGRDCVLIETPRREINKLISSVDGVRRVIDENFIARAIQTSFAPQSSLAELRDVAGNARLNRWKAGQAIFTEGDAADSLHLIRSGSVSVSRDIGGREVVSSYVAAGNYVGEMGLVSGTARSATVRATVATETISLDAATFHALLARNPRLREQVEATVQRRLAENTRMAAQPQSGDLISFLMRQGLGEATDVLLIDETLCIGCDNCEEACASTHGGTSRLDREAGPTFANIHVPTSCRHCEDPHCMTECPPDAIGRSPEGEVFIRDNCIGCGNCERNCPYGVIQMAAAQPARPGLWSWLLFGTEGGGQVDPQAPKKAVKCDMCRGQSGGPACVRACPTGAAIRIGPEKFVELVHATVS
jgi:CRP-like cAMP-binding protein/ferredoxin-like protein FixX